MKNIQNLRKMKEKGTWGHVSNLIIDLILKYAGNSVLDVGCAKGGYVEALSKNGYKIYGIDLFLQYKNTQKFVLGTATDLPFKDNSFDTILLLDVLEHIENEEKVLNEVYRVCSKNIIFSVPHEDKGELEHYYLTYRPYWDISHVRYYSLEDIASKLENVGFKIIKIMYADPINPLGLFLHLCGVPHRFSIFIGKHINKLPFVRKHFTKIVGVAEKK